MKTAHKLVLLAAFTGGALMLLKRYSVWRREREARALDDLVGLRDAHGRVSIDDVPVVQPAEPYEPGQAPQPQDLRIAQNVLE